MPKKSELTKVIESMKKEIVAVTEKANEEIAIIKNKADVLTQVLQKLIAKLEEKNVGVKKVNEKVAKK